MYIDLERINLLDLIDIGFLQKFQDSFAKTMDIPTITFDLEGPITKPYGLSEFCNKYIKNTPEGEKKCSECDLNYAKMAAEKGEPIIDKCHAGLTGFVVPIKVKEKHIGSILCGQFFVAPPDENHFIEIAQQGGFDIGEYIKMLKELKIIPINRVREAANLLFIVANAISEIAYKNLELKEKNEREKFNRKILEILRNILDKETIKHLFVKNVGQYFQADRVFFSDYDSEINMYLPVTNKSEYLSSPEEKSFVGYDWSNDSISEYIQPLLEKRELKIFCLDEYLKDNPKSQGFVSRFKNWDVKSSYNLPVIYEGTIMGYFCIEYTKGGCKRLSDEDISRIRSMCSQAGIALHNAELYLKAQESVETKKEFIKDITNNTLSMLDNVMELLEAISKTEEKCENHVKHLNHIAKIAEKFLDFVNKIRKDISI